MWKKKKKDCAEAIVGHITPKGFFLSFTGTYFPLPEWHKRENGEYINYSVSNPTTGVQLHI